VWGGGVQTDKGKGKTEGVGMGERKAAGTKQEGKGNRKE